MAPPAPPPSQDPEWTFEGLKNSNQVETEIKEEEEMRDNPGPTLEEMFRQIRATKKWNIKYDQMQEGNPTLTGILRRRQYSPTRCKDEEPQELKFHHTSHPPSAPQRVSNE